MTEAFDGLLLLPRLRVQNANAISGPLTWGFPAPTAFTGFVHALSRKLPELGLAGLVLEGAGIVCHGFEPQMGGGYVKSFRLTRNPVDQDGSSPAFVEEGRTHLEVSLLIGVRSDSLWEQPESQLAVFAQSVHQLAQGLRLAGGSILPASPGMAHRPELLILPQDRDDRDGAFRKLRRKLLPGFALVSRDDVLHQRLDELRAQQAGTTPLDALLDLCALHWDCNTEATDDGTAKVDWHIRARRGWLVPVPVGYAAISPLYEPGSVLNARDKTVPFRFVESMYSLGEWVSPHRITDLRKLMWTDRADPERGLYRCLNTAFASETAGT